MAPRTRTRDPEDVIKSYRYLRIGLIGAVVLLAVSIGIERSKVHCWQTSISAYYFTPVRAVFVGTLIAVGLSLIVYTGRTSLEDICLNFAGMFAPVVAVAPTTDVGNCWSVPPHPLPRHPDGSLATWVVTNIHNNFNALLIAGAAGLIVAVLIAVLAGGLSAPFKVNVGTSVSLVVTGLALIGGWLASRYWSDFDTRAHGIAAVTFFVFLIGAIMGNAVGHRHQATRLWFGLYTGIAAMMTVGALFIWLTRVFGSHTVFALESYEIVFFAAYWIAQTVEDWPEHIAASG